MEPAAILHSPAWLPQPACPPAHGEDAGGWCRVNAFQLGKIGTRIESSSQGSCAGTPSAPAFRFGTTQLLSWYIEDRHQAEGLPGAGTPTSSSARQTGQTAGWG